MSHAHVSAFADGHDAPAFTTGRRVVITTKRKQQQQQQQTENATEHEEPHASGSGRRRGGRGQGDRPRLSVKDRRPADVRVSVSSVVEPAAASADADPSAAAMDESSTGGGAAAAAAAPPSLLSVGTEQRRRVVEVRQRNSRESRLNERREAALANQSSGFNTARGQRRALIVLPKNAEKMAAREQLMQIHPHIAQVFRGLNPPDTFTQEAFARVLAAEAPTMPYRRRNQEVKTVVQWGERRLFLYELEFLTQYGVRPGTVVVYAGCAPATRLTFLAELFPHVHFVLVDEVPLDVDESALTNVRVRQEPFTDAIARELRAAATAEDKTLLFIANATADTQLGDLGFVALQSEEYTPDQGFVKSAMDDQKRWFTLLKPAKALLKFSLPWTDDSTHYLDGDVVLPVWSGPTSTEVRLVPNAHMRTWSHRHFEEQMMHFNTVTRVSLHEHGVTAEGLDGCYDCTAEVFILERYLERYPAMLPVACGSQLGVVPAAPAPATQLKLDSTRFADPKWQEAQRAKQAALLRAGRKREADHEAPTTGSDGQPLTEAELAAAQAAREAADAIAETSAQMEEDEAEAAGAPASSAAAAAASSAALAAVAPAADSSMGDAAQSEPLTALEILKQNVGQFSQEISRRITHGGSRTLATANAAVIKRAAFTRKNRH